MYVIVISNPSPLIASRLVFLRFASQELKEKCRELPHSETGAHTFSCFMTWTLAQGFCFVNHHVVNEILYCYIRE